MKGKIRKLFVFMITFAVLSLLVVSCPEGITDNSGGGNGDYRPTYYVEGNIGGNTYLTQAGFVFEDFGNVFSMPYSGLQVAEEYDPNFKDKINFWHIYFSGINIGKYNTKSAMFTSLIYFFDSEHSCSTNLGGDVTIDVTVYDTTNKIIKGTFEGKVKDSSSLEIVNVSGDFNVKY